LFGTLKLSTINTYLIIQKKGGGHIKKKDKKEHTPKNHEIRVKTPQKIKKT